MTLFTSSPMTIGSPENIFELLNSIEHKAREILAAKDLPTDLAAWTNKPAFDALEHFTLEKRMVDALHECRHVRAAIDAGDAALAAWNAAYLITGLEHANFDEWEKPIRAGLGTMQGGRKSAEKINASYERPSKEKLLSEISRIEKQTRIGRTEVVKLAAKSLGIGKSTAYKILKE